MTEDREKQIDMDVTDTNEEAVDREERRVEARREEQAPVDRRQAAPVTDDLEPLFESEEAKKFRSRWLAIQSKFVDDPRESVKQADDLVADVIKNITMNFSNRRVNLEKQWNSGDNISTEDMRVAVQRYRSFFDRLLTLES
jgi:hypothetical protein